MILRKAITPADAAAISKRRRELEAAVAVQEIAFAKQQVIVAKLGAVLRPPNPNRGPTRADKERAKLKQVANALFTAECDLRDFESVNPSEEALMELQRQRALQEQERKRRICQQQQQIPSTN